MSGPDVTAPRKPSGQHLQAVHERLVASAQAPRATAPGVFIRRYQYSAGQIPGWVVQRARTVEPTARPSVLRLSQLTLARPDDPAQLVKLDVYETPSPDAARELMVELLTGYQSLPGRVELADDVGDAEVIFPGDGTRIFTRGNLVILLVNAGARGRTVGELARSLDDFLMAESSPAAPSRATPARTRRAAASPASPEDPSVASPAPPDPMTRYMARSGKLRQKADGSIAAQGSERLVMSTLEPGARSWQSRGKAAVDKGKPPEKRSTPRRSRPRRKKS